MNSYILNRDRQDSKSGKNYEVHNEDICNRLPLAKNRIFLGYFSDCHGALRDAKAKHPSLDSDIDGCYQCCPDCHRE
jgi:hypothetical protein